MKKLTIEDKFTCLKGKLRYRDLCFKDITISAWIFFIQIKLAQEPKRNRQGDYAFFFFSVYRSSVTLLELSPEKL